jgi:CAAX prenyl protease-like protein
VSQDLLKKVVQSPVLVRVLPFAIFLALTSFQGRFGAASAYWFYAAKTVLCGWMVWALRPWIAEMKWQFTPAALLGGVGVLVMWVGIDSWYPHMDAVMNQYLNPLFARLGFKTEAAAAPAVWNPHLVFGENTSLAWFFVVMRVLGSTFVVPPLEEVFYRSFLYRYIARPDFQKASCGVFLWKPFVITSVLFGLTHNQWLAGILCGFAFQGLVLWKGRLDDAITAHAITNFLLALWVIWKGAWQFW